MIITAYIILSAVIAWRYVDRDIDGLQRDMERAGLYVPRWATATLAYLMEMVLWPRWAYRRARLLWINKARE